MGYAVVLGEALLDLLDADLGGEQVYRQAVGGGPLNVAVGVARLGGSAQFVGSLGDDVPARRIRDFLTANGVGLTGVVTVPTATTLAVVTLAGAEPDFRFYGDSHGRFGPDHLDERLVTEAAVLCCGSIALLWPPTLAAARRAWRLTTGMRVFDPNVRPRLLSDAAARADLRAVVTEFTATADLVKLSAADADLLWPGESPERAAARLRAAGADVVVVTLGPAGALVVADDQPVRIPAPRVRAVDATGAGDSVLAALVADLLDAGRPAALAGWVDRVGYALRVAGLVCESPGGATAMPTRDQVARRFASGDAGPVPTPG